LIKFSSELLLYLARASSSKDLSLIISNYSSWAFAFIDQLTYIPYHYNPKNINGALQITYVPVLLHHYSPKTSIEYFPSRLRRRAIKLLLGVQLIEIMN
jgi:hypothetical protein